MAAAAAQASPRFPLAKIHPSPTNPRKRFDEAKLNELAVSIKEHDVVQAIKIRPHPKKPGEYMLVVGERRWRAAEIAGLVDIPAIVEDLTDLQVFEQQLVENSQRADIHPIEEADAYRAVIDSGEHTIDTLAAKIGKSRSHVYGRLKLLDLIPAARKACLDGKLQPACAELVARADAKVQPEFLKDALGQGGDYYDADVEPEQIQDEDGRTSRDDSYQPLSFRALQQLYHRKYTLRLDTAPFTLYDERLVPAAGACTACPKRTGGQPDLFPDLKKPADSCTDPKCFASKVKAHWAERAESAKAMGHKVVEYKKNDGATSITIDGKPGYNSEFVTADQTLPYEIAKPGSNATFGKLLGKLEATVPKILVQDERGGAHLVLDKKAAIKVLRDAGKLDEAKKPSSSSSSSGTTADHKKEQAKNKEKRELRTEAFKRVLEDLGTGAKEFDFGNTRKLLVLVRMLALQILAHADLYDGAEEFLEPIYGAKPNLQDALENAIVEAKTTGGVLAVIALILATEQRDSIVGELMIGDSKKLFEELCTLFGADWKDAQERAKTAAKVEAKSEVAKAKAKPTAAAKGGVVTTHRPSKKKGK